MRRNFSFGKVAEASPAQTSVGWFRLVCVFGDERGGSCRFVVVIQMRILYLYMIIKYYYYIYVNMNCKLVILTS